MLNKPLIEVMLSSTFRDLEPHRAHVSAVLKQHRLHAITMEDDASLSDQDMIDASLAKVKAASGYVCIIGKRYGQIRICPLRNPNELSLTELEFEQAIEEKIPVTVLMMEPRYPVGDEQNEFEPTKRAKLQAFRERVGRPHRVTADFDCWEAFLKIVPTAISELRNALDKRLASGTSIITSADVPPLHADDVFPLVPPAFHVVKPFTQGHPFIGREKELERITRWATGPNPLLLFEAIGGMGKSMVTYRWTDGIAPTVRADWAGRLWYSFYEEGASMNDFCVHALAYVERRPSRHFLGRRTSELEPLLLKHLNDEPWLIVMDGLERVLVAYHRFDKAQAREEEAVADPNRTGRDPNRCIHPADDHLLQALVTARASKLLVSTRNTPTVLLNASDSPIVGVERERLTGLEPEDAERLICEAGVKGTSLRIRNYLETHFECHPLMVGVVAGLANAYVPAPGNFDRWLDDPQGADAVDITRLDGLIAKRDHILKVAYEALEPDARKLLGVLAFFSQSVAGEVLTELNPKRPTKPNEVKKPTLIAEENDIALRLLKQSSHAKIKSKIAARRVELQKHFEEQNEAYRQYEAMLVQWRASSELRAADAWLGKAMVDLQKRGLVITDRLTARYDLHPMVRSFVRHALTGDDSASTGRAVADHARSRSVAQYEAASSLADLSQGMQAVTALTLGGHYKDAGEALGYALRAALLRLELFSEWQALLRPFFSQGWDSLPDKIPDHVKGDVLMGAAACFEGIDDRRRAERLNQLAIAYSITKGDLYGVAICTHNYSILIERIGRLARCVRLLHLCGTAAEISGISHAIVTHQVRIAELDLSRGLVTEARSTLASLMAEPEKYKSDGQLEADVLWFETVLLEKEGRLSEARLDSAIEAVCRQGQRFHERQLHYRRGIFLQSKGEHQRSVEAFEQSIAMARVVNAPTGAIDARYAASLFAVGRTVEALEVARRIECLDEPPHLELAQLYLMLKEKEKSRRHALAAYQKAWADGPPYSFYWDLEDCRKVLKTLDEPEPRLSPFDSAKIQPFEFESDLYRLIEKTKAAIEEK